MRPLHLMLLGGILVGLALDHARAQPGSKANASLWKYRAEVARRPTGDALAKLTSDLENLLGRDSLANGARPRVEGTTALFAVKLPPSNNPAPPREFAYLKLNDQRLAMMPLAPGSNLFVLFKDLPNFSQHSYAYEAETLARDGEKPVTRALSSGSLRLESFDPHRDSQSRPDVPKGAVKRSTWKTSKIYPQTEREWAVYVPAVCKPDGPPACVMIFQDGISYLGGEARVPVVLDNLIHRGELPPMVGVFINPGQEIGKSGGRTPSNRSVEYDTLSDAYARFLLEEMLPAAEQLAGVKLRTDAASRGLAGRSSGAICAFTAAWQKPDQFSKVLSAIGSYTNIRGGDVYPGKIRKEPKRALRVFLQDGSNDLDNEHGNWWLANQQMAKALALRNYDFTFVTGEGFHSGKHEAAILPDALRWLWRDYHPETE